MIPDPNFNFCRVFELPESFPRGYLFGGSKPVSFLMVDWFNPWPVNDNHVGLKDMSIEEWKCQLIDFLQDKDYVKKGRCYVVITDFDESVTFTGNPRSAAIDAVKKD